METSRSRSPALPLSRFYVKVVFLVMRVIVVIIGLVAGVLGYGYWHRSSHATLTVVLTDSSKKERDGRVLNAELVFLDASSKLIAQSGWLTGWVGDLRYISVVLGDCQIERIPVEVAVVRDSLLTGGFRCATWEACPIPVTPRSLKWTFASAR